MTEETAQKILQELADIKHALGEILQPMQELEIHSVARDVSKGSVTALSAWNAKKKAQRKKR